MLVYNQNILGSSLGDFGYRYLQIRKSLDLFGKWSDNIQKCLFDLLVCSAYHKIYIFRHSKRDVISLYSHVNILRITRMLINLIFHVK